MPQLNPSPWLMIFFMVWTFLLLILFNKALKLTHLNLPEMKKMEKASLSPWSWPWY